MTNKPPSDLFEHLQAARRNPEAHLDSFLLRARNLAWRRLGHIYDKHLHDDAVQDAVITIYRNLGNFNGRDSIQLRSWIGQIAHNAGHHAAMRPDKLHEVPYASLSREKDIDELLDAIMRASRPGRENARFSREEIAAAYGRLHSRSPRQALALKLVHIDGLSAREAAPLIGTKEANVRALAFRARKWMRMALDEEEG